VVGCKYCIKIYAAGPEPLNSHERAAGTLMSPPRSAATQACHAAAKSIAASGFGLWSPLCAVE
jgi:hypothetical protein